MLDYKYWNPALQSFSYSADGADDNSIACQFTTVVDNNDQKIYEHDIVRVGQSAAGEVTFGSFDVSDDDTSNPVQVIGWYVYFHKEGISLPLNNLYNVVGNSFTHLPDGSLASDL